MVRLLTLVVAFAASAGLGVAAQADTTLQQLANIRLDKAQIYSVRDITLARDVLSISLNRGAIAFTEAIDGKVTGAVFIGSGDILAIPPDPIEKRQLFRYTKAALLNQHFETAVFRFTDGTWEEILRELRRHADERVDAADADALLRWESEIQRRGAYLNERLLEDLLGSRARPLFLAQIEGTQLGWFDAIYDDRRVEEVLIEQNTTASSMPLLWASFNKRTDPRDPAAVAHEDKSVFDIMDVDSQRALLRLKMKADGERVLTLPFSSAGITGVTLDGDSIPLLSGNDLTVILPAPSKAGSELSLAISHAPDISPALFTSAASKANSVSPWSYRDQWIIEALTGYGSVLTDPQLLARAREQLLAPSPQGGSNEGLGPVSIGFRMTQPYSGPASGSALRNKSLWILHMLRNAMRREESEESFGRFLDELVAQTRGARISTFDLKQLAEKHAGKSLDQFFDSWVFGTGIPNYEVTSRIEAGANGFVISGNVTQSGVPDTFEMQVPLYADDVFLGDVTVSSEGGEFRFTSPTRPMEILVDPKGTILTQ